MRIYILTILFTLLIISGCSDSGTDSGEPEQEELGLAVRIVNTGSEDLDIQTGSDAHINFCYENAGCESGSGQSFYTIFAGQSSIIIGSQPDEHAVGIKVGFTVTGGQGKAEVVRGRSYLDNGFREFEPSEVIHTSDSFSGEGDVHFEVGETD